MNAETDEIAYFCHGMPGSEHDARLIKTVDDRVRLIAPNLLTASSLDPMHDLLADFDESTREIADGQINVVGFSIGAMAAIKIAAARPKRVGRLTLISPAAPLSLGDFLPEMAGKPVFDLAITRPRTLRVLTFVQGLVSAVAPGFLIKQLFAKCGPAEKKLIDNKTFQEVIRHSFANSFRRHPAAYVRFVRSYVGDWSSALSNISCPVDLWHGEKDTWSPIAMSHALQEALAGPAHLNSIPDTEHYSTLSEVSLAPIGEKTA
ncbi:MAG: alpha/beta hydrolase [Pseudoruegeria sp.]